MTTTPIKAYRKILPVNDDGSEAGVTMFASISRIGAGCGVFPSVALLRALSVHRGTHVDVRVFSYESRVGLMITIADKKVASEPGAVRKKVMDYKKDRFCVPLPKSMCDELELRIKDRVAVQYIPRHRAGRNYYPSRLFVYKEPGMGRNETKEQSLIQTAVEIAGRCKSGSSKLRAG